MIQASNPSAAAATHKVRPAVAELAKYFQLVHEVEPLYIEGGGLAAKLPGIGEVKVDVAGGYACAEQPSLAGQGAVEMHLQISRKPHREALAELEAAGVLEKRPERLTSFDPAKLGEGIGIEQEEATAEGLVPAPVEVIRAAHIDRINILAASKKAPLVYKGLMDAKAAAKLRTARGEPLAVVELDEATLLPKPDAEFAAVGADAQLAGPFGFKLADAGLVALTFRKDYMAQGAKVSGDDDPYLEEGEALAKVRAEQMAIMVHHCNRKHSVAYQTREGDWQVLLELTEGTTAEDEVDLSMRCGLYDYPAPWVQLLGGDTIVPAFVRSRPRAAPELIATHDQVLVALAQPRTDEVAPPPETEGYNLHLINPLFKGE